MTFTITITDTSLLKNSFSSINKVVDTARIEVDNDGLRLNAIDRGHTLFTSLYISNEDMRYMDIIKPSSITIDTQELYTILKRIKKEEPITLIANGNTLYIKADGEYNKTFKIKLLDDDYEPPRMPRIDYQCILDMPSRIFSEACKDIYTFTKKVQLKTTHDRITFNGAGLSSDASIEYPADNINISMDETAVSHYDIDKINEILRSSKFCNTVTLSYGSDMPLLVTYGDVDDTHLSFLLAPRIETEE